MSRFLRLARTITEEELQLEGPVPSRPGSFTVNPNDVAPSPTDPGGANDDQPDGMEEAVPLLQSSDKGIAGLSAHGEASRSPLVGLGSTLFSKDRSFCRDLCFLILLLLAIFMVSLSWWSSNSCTWKASRFVEDEVLTNGTHPFKRTVLLVSLDGLRADYVDRNLTTHLHDISVKGLRAKWMKPVFPTLTFPNHWALMTGLYAESHGIIANTFFDPVTSRIFEYTKPEHSWDATWWLGEPIWATAGKAGIITANLMWPGPPKTMHGDSPDYYVAFENNVALSTKHDRIFEWLDLPFDQRPQLITAYEPSVDQIGHKYGPESPEVNAALQAVDAFARDIHSSLAARNLSHIVDVVFVSDHGMVDTSDLRLVYMDDILGDGFQQIEHADGWPSMGLRFHPSTNLTEMLRRLEAGAAKFDPPAFDVYATHSFPASLRSSGSPPRIDDMPERYHFSNHPRIAPIYVVPRVGWALTNRHEHLTVMNGQYEPRGNHGYDNLEPAMRAIFVADGPFSTATKRKQSSKPSSPSTGPGPTPVAPGQLIMEGFDNVQLYNLVCKLLGLQAVAPNNGTQGFWDDWLD